MTEPLSATEMNALDRAILYAYQHRDVAFTVPVDADVLRRLMDVAREHPLAVERGQDAGREVRHLQGLISEMKHAAAVGDGQTHSDAVGDNWPTVDGQRAGGFGGAK